MTENEEVKTSEMPRDFHFGRHFQGTETEDACPCVKAACGLVKQTVPECLYHPVIRMKTMRQGHTAENCPEVMTSKQK